MFVSECLPALEKLNVEIGDVYPTVRLTYILDDGKEYAIVFGFEDPDSDDDEMREIRSRYTRLPDETDEEFEDRQEAIDDRILESY